MPTSRRYTCLISRYTEADTWSSDLTQTQTGPVPCAPQQSQPHTQGASLGTVPLVSPHKPGAGCDAGGAISNYCLTQLTAVCLLNVTSFGANIPSDGPFMLFTRVFLAVHFALSCPVSPGEWESSRQWRGRQEEERGQNVKRHIWKRMSAREKSGPEEMNRNIATAGSGE